MRAMPIGTRTGFTRTLLIVVAGSVLLLLVTDSGWSGYVATGGVFVVAIVQHAVLSSMASRRIREIIRREDPDAPDAVGEVAAAVRERIAEERLGAERQNADIRTALQSGSVAVFVTDRRGVVLNAVGSGVFTPDGDPPSVSVPSLVRMFESVLEDGLARTELVSGHQGTVVQWTAVKLDDEAVGSVVTDVTEVQRVQAMRTNFVTDASHELKTPVATIRTSAEALQLALERGDARAVGFARRLEEQAVRLGRIVNDLLDLSRLEGELPVLEPLDLGDLVEREVAAVRAEAADAGIGVHVDLSTVRILGCERDVGLAVRNLLTNAVRYSPEGGEVAVTLRAERDEAVVAVVDSGIGIDPADQERVFERFFRADSARSRSTGGTGLGLSIVRHVMSQHGGTAAVESTPGLGSTFSLRFPVERDPAGSPRPTPAPALQEHAPTNP